jgi:hypothetical protein
MTTAKRKAPSLLGEAEVTLVEALRRKECAIMRRRELEVEIMQGRLVNAAEVEAVVRSDYMITAQRLLQIPSKVAPRCAAMRTAADVEALLHKEFTSALNTLSDEAGERLRKSEAKAK